MFIKSLTQKILIFIIFIEIFLLAIFSWGIDKFENLTLNTIFATLTPIFVFVIGQFAKSFSDLIKQREKDKQLRRVYLRNLETISRGLILQLKDFNNVVNLLKEDKTEDLILNSYAELDNFEVNRISSTDIYRIFIDDTKGNDDNKLNLLENLRTQLRFLEESKNSLHSDFERLWQSARKDGNKVINAMAKLGQFWDSETTKLVQTSNIGSDTWHKNFTVVWDKARKTLKISNDTRTDFLKIEEEIIPTLSNFAKDNFRDSRTPMITEIFSEITANLFSRRDTVNSIYHLIQHYLTTYENANLKIKEALDYYYKN